eukprot:6641762-Pyramimonas_sp.AAC.1
MSWRRLNETAGALGESDVRLVHCCDADGTTYDCAFRVLDFTDMEDVNDQRSINNARDVQEVIDFWPYMSAFNTTCTWCASWFILRETAAIPVEFIPAVQDYVEFGKTAHRQWWGGQSDMDDALRPKRKRRR